MNSSVHRISRISHLNISAAHGDDSCLLHLMMTSSNGNIFRVTSHLCGEFTGPWWTPRTKASDAELWCFLICAWIKGWINNREAGDLIRHRAHYTVFVMLALHSTINCGCQFQMGSISNSSFVYCACSNVFDIIRPHDFKVSSHMPSKMWDKITYRFPNSISVTL